MRRPGRPDLDGDTMAASGGDRTGYWVSKLLYVAARLNVADHLEAGPREVDELAAGVGTDPRRLKRCMMVLTGGLERTEAEFAELLDRAGLRLERIVTTECPLSIVVAAPAG